MLKLLLTLTLLPASLMGGGLLTGPFDWGASAGVLDFPSVSTTDTFSGSITIIANHSNQALTQQLAAYYSGVCPSFANNAVAGNSGSITVNGTTRSFGVGCPTLGTQNSPVYFPITWGVPVEVSFFVRASAVNTISSATIHIFAYDVTNPGTLGIAASAEALPEPATWALGFSGLLLLCQKCKRPQAG